MKVKTLSEIPSAKGIIPAGRVIEIAPELLERLQGKVKEIPNGGKDLPHYCRPGACFCSSLLPQNSHPAECIRTGCEHYQPAA